MDAPLTRNGPTRRRPRSLGRLLLLLWLLAVLGVVAAAWYVLEPERLARRLEHRFTEKTGMTTFIDRAVVTPGGSIRIEGLEMRIPGVPAGGDRLLEAPETVLELDGGAMLQGRLRVERLTLERPRISIVEIGEEGTYHFARLRSKGDPDAAPSEFLPLPDRLPEIRLNGGTVEFGTLVDHHHRVRARFDLAGTLSRDTGEPDRYHFAWRAGTGAPGQAAHARGVLDLAQARVHVRVERFRLAPAHRRLIPAKWRQAWDRLQPSGTLREITLDHQPGAGTSVEAAFHRLALSLDASYRLEQLDGRLRLDEKGLALENIRGNLRDPHLAFTAGGRLEALAPEAPFELEIEIQPFELVPEPAYQEDLPPLLARLFTIYRPEGPVSADLRLSRTTPGGGLATEGRVELLGLDARYWHFPYPARNITGTIELTPEHASFDDLRAEIDGEGTLALRGRIAPIQRHPAVDLVIEAADVPVNQTLLASMEPSHRRLTESFLDQAALARLRGEGLVRRSAQTGEQAGAGRAEAPREAAAPPDAPPDASPGTSPATAPAAAAEKNAGAPAFDLGGEADVRVHVKRPIGEAGRYSTELAIETRGLGILMTRWPYPLELEGGRLIIESGRVRAEAIETRGLTGMRGRVEGELALLGEGAAPAGASPSAFRFTVASVPVDPLFISAIPPPRDRWVRALGIEGRLEATGTVSRDAEGELIFDIRPHLSGGRMRPFESGITLSNLEADLALGRHELQIERLRGARGAMTLTATGQIGMRERKPEVALSIEAERLPLEAEWLGLLPPGLEVREKLEALFESHRPEGVVDLALAWGGAGDAPSPYRLRLWPRHASFRLGAARLGATDMSGAVEVEPGRIELHELSGRHGPESAGHFSVSGAIDPAATLAATSAELTGRASAPGLDPALLAALPAAFRKHLEPLDLDFGYKITGAAFTLRPPAQEAAEGGARPRPRWRLEADAELTDGRFQAVFPVTEGRGHLDLEIESLPGATFPHGRLHLERAGGRIAGRPFEQLELLATRAAPEGPDAPSPPVRIETLEAVMMDGLLSGTGQFEPGRAGTYRLRLMLEEATLGGDPAPPADPGASGHEAASGEGAPKPDSPEAAAPAKATGTLNAEITLEGRWGQPEAREGRGALSIQGAPVYELPGIAGALHLLNLQLPRQAAFERVSSRFLVEGRRARIERLAFEAPALHLVGGGFISLGAEHALDLVLISEAPEALELGPLSELFEMVRDELVTLRIQGTLTEPEPSVISFQGARALLRRLFGEAEQQEAPSPEPAD